MTRLTVLLLVLAGCSEKVNISVNCVTTVKLENLTLNGKPQE